MDKNPKNENFRRLAASRVNKISLAMRSLAKLSNKKNYEYSKAEVAKIVSTLKSELKAVESSFAANSPRKEFKL